MDNASTQGGDSRRSNWRRELHHARLGVGVAPKSVNSSPALPLLPFVFSVIAGCTDVISFLGLVVCSPPVSPATWSSWLRTWSEASRTQVALMLSVTVFIAALALTRLLVAAYFAAQSVIAIENARLLKCPNRVAESNLFISTSFRVSLYRPSGAGPQPQQPSLVQLATGGL